MLLTRVGSDNLHWSVKQVKKRIATLLIASFNFGVPADAAS